MGHWKNNKKFAIECGELVTSVKSPLQPLPPL